MAHRKYVPTQAITDISDLATLGGFCLNKLIISLHIQRILVYAIIKKFLCGNVWVFMVQRVPVTPLIGQPDVIPFFDPVGSYVFAISLEKKNFRTAIHRVHQ